MIPVRGLITSLRFALKDMQGAAASDFELIEALNQAAALLYTRMGEKFIPAAVKKTVLVTVDGDTTLPSDFHNVRTVKGEYGLVCRATPIQARHRDEFRIFRDRFEAADGAYGFEYYYVPRRVASDTDDLDAPLSVRPYLEEVALSLMRGDAERAELAVQKCCHSLAGAEISGYQNTGPVQIWGGKA